jgi:hypothetical protein
MTRAPNITPGATFTPSPDIDVIFQRQFVPRAVLPYRRDDGSPVWMTNKRWARRVLRACAYGFACACVVALVCGIVMVFG